MGLKFISGYWVRYAFLLLLTWGNIIFLFSQSIDQSINELEFQALQHEKAGKTLELASCQIKLGNLYRDKGNDSKAIEYFQKAIKANEDIGNLNAIKNLCTQIGQIYFDADNFEQATIFFKKSLRINEKQKKQAEIVADLINIANALQGSKGYFESNQHLERAVSLAQELADINSLKICYGMLSENSDKLGSRDKAKEYFELAAALKSHMQKEEIKKYESRTKQAEAEVYEKDNTIKTKEQEIQKITREQQLTNQLLQQQQEIAAFKDREYQAKERLNEAKRRNTYLIIASLGFILIFVLGSLFAIFKQLREKKKAYLLLEQSNQLIIEQKKETEIQRDIANNQKKKITDSILYAKRIQTAVLPPITMIDKVLPEYFVFFRPRDIVSGDFYWLTEKDGILIIAAADCTGHGVPGAFMSMLGIAYLNEIVNKIAFNKHIRSLHASEILNQLKEVVINSLHQTGKADETKDGMDIALCVIDMENRQLQFAGAHNPLYIIRDGELVVVESDKMPIGIYKTNLPFTNREIELKENDQLYIFSDGYYDQFGGKSGSKMFSANFRKFLLEISSKPMSEQKQLLENNYDNWKGEREQVDDVLVIGFKYFPHAPKVIAPQANVWPEKRILIAEDVDINFFLLSEALKPTKAQVFRVVNGHDAVEFCKHHDIDIVLMDIRMPVMDGMEATRQIKKFKKDLPIVAQTAQSQPDDLVMIAEAGCDDYISKPIDQKKFIEILKKHLLK